MSSRSNQMIPVGLGNAVGVLAGVAVVACLLGYWEWLFLTNVRNLVHSGLADARPVNRQVWGLVLNGFGKRVVVGHIAIVSGLLCLAFMAKRRDLALATARTFVAILTVAICVLAVLWFPLLQYAIPRSPRQWPNPHWDVLQLNVCWLVASLVLGVLYCRRPIRRMPVLLIISSAAFLVAVVGFCWTLAVFLGFTKLWPGEVWALRMIGKTLWPFFLSAAILGASGDPVVRKGAAWLMVLAAATSPQLWADASIELWMCPSTSSYTGANIDVPLHVVFVFIEIGLAYLVWLRRRGLLEPQELRGGFPVIQEKEEKVPA